MPMAVAPIKKNSVIENANSSAIRLWSVVVSHGAVRGVVGIEGGVVSGR
jgi:hypothetical protein